MSKYYEAPWFNGFNVYDFKNKNQIVREYMLKMLCELQSMFEYDGLPETVPKRELELMLMTGGYAGFAKVDNNLYAVWGGLGGEPDPYYEPTILNSANPALPNLKPNMVINKDCIVVKNDSVKLGLMPLLRRYATMMTEALISLRMATINSRAQKGIVAGNDNAKDAAEQYIKRLEIGDFSVIADSAFIEAIKSIDVGNGGASNAITQLIEELQYFKAGLFNELGLNSNYNMKREAINSNEVQMNNDSLLPFVDDMLHCREEGIDKVNKMFGTNISVKLGSAWEIRRDEIEMIEESLSADSTIENVETDTEEVKDEQA